VSPEPAPLRRAGRGTDAARLAVTWSMAEGRRGSRWREVRVAGDAVVSSLLLELDPDERFAHLELATAAGLLTLHPEGDGTLHGNAIVASGVQHIVAVAWEPTDGLLVEGSTIARAAAARGPAATAEVVIGLDLTIDRRSLEAPAQPMDLDVDGLPVLVDGETWPLELDD
jgi:hypothetical protein